MKYIKSLFLLRKKNNSLSHLTVITLSLMLIVGCSPSSEKAKQIIVVGVSADVATINPLYAFDLLEGHLIDLLFLKPASENWNDSLGIIEFSPSLASNWQINRDSNFITLNLREDIFWSDGKPITSDDIIFSFDVFKILSAK